MHRQYKLTIMDFLKFVMVQLMDGQRFIKKD